MASKFPMTSAAASVDPTMPPRALWIAVSGFVPFLVTGFMVVFGSPEDADFARYLMLYYAAAVLAFMGGIHWGLIKARYDEGSWTRLPSSLIPTVLGWTALMLPLIPALWLIVLAFLVFMLDDLLAILRGLAPRSYPRLRLPVTLGVELCLLAAILL